MEGVFATNAPAGLHLFGWVNEDGTVVGPEIPGLLSWLVSATRKAPITGLGAVPEADWPPVNHVFQAFHAMVAIGFGLLALVLVALVQLWRGKLFETRWLLWLVRLRGARTAAREPARLDDRRARAPAVDRLRAHAHQ